MVMRENFLPGLLRRIFLTVSIVVVFTFFSMQTRPAFADTWSFVRIIHASPDAGTVDLFMDGKKLLSNFQFGTITGYAPVTVGSHNIQIAVIGTGINASVLSQTVTFNPNTPYTVAALGTKSTGFSLQVFADNNLVSGNTAKVRVYHLSPGTGTVNVATSGKTLVDGLPYAQASNYVSVPSGAYTFNVTATEANATLPVSADLKAWTVTSIFAVGMINGNPKFQFINSQVTGTPGMPGTGSDPHALPNYANTQFSSAGLWLWGTMALLLVGIGFAVRFRISGKKVGK
ncbi:MAG: hypothetical protein NVS4B7_03240 [Ktedonobacteraceae bacterium]